jgi:hypothetical protein
MKISPHTLVFIERWREKAQGYLFDENPANYFDRFFTEFILYNCLYNEINRICCLRLDGDKNKAVAAAKAFLTSEAILAEQMVTSGRDEILNLIQLKEFYIWKEQTDYQCEPVKKLRSPNPNEQIDGLLEIIYGVRCNLFHGEKEFLGNQKRILKPCICVIEKLNGLIIEKFQRDDANSAACSPRRNAL